VKRIVPLVLAIVAFFTTGLLWIVADRRASRHAYDTYSTANTGEEGLSLASRYLSKSRKVAMLTRPLGRVPLERNAVVFRVVEEVPHLFDPQEIEEKAPTKPLPSALLNDDEHAFVRGGGRLVIAAERALLDTATAPDLVAKRVFPLWPNVGQLALPFRRGFRDPGPRALTLFASGPYAVVTRERIGAGELSSPRRRSFRTSSSSAAITSRSSPRWPARIAPSTSTRWCTASSATTARWH